MKYYFFIALFFTLIGFAFYLEVSTWNECRTNNSFFYCMRVMSR